jgi:hypothetical protein
MPVLPKWTAFDDVFAAVERASTDPAHHGVTSGAV